MVLLIFWLTLYKENNQSFYNAQVTGFGQQMNTTYGCRVLFLRKDSEEDNLLALSLFSSFAHITRVIPLVIMYLTFCMSFPFDCIFAN